MKKFWPACLVLVLCALSFSTPTGSLVSSYGQILQVNKPIGDTIRIDTLKIKQKEGGVFVGDSLTPIKIPLALGGRFANGSEISILIKQLASGTDSAQMGFGFGYSLGGFWVMSGNSIDSTKTFSNFITSNRDTGDNQLLYFRAPRDADSIALYIHTTKTTCHTCRMLILPNYLRSR